MYGARRDNVVCSLFGRATLATSRGSETLFVHVRMKTPNASPQAIEVNPRCSVQAHSKLLSTGPKNENTEYGCAFGMSVLCLQFVY